MSDEGKDLGTGWRRTVLNWNYYILPLFLIVLFIIAAGIAWFWTPLLFAYNNTTMTQAAINNVTNVSSTASVNATIANFTAAFIAR